MMNNVTWHRSLILLAFLLLIWTPLSGQVGGTGHDVELILVDQLPEAWTERGLDLPRVLGAVVSVPNEKQQVILVDGFATPPVLAVGLRKLAEASQRASDEERPILVVFGWPEEVRSRGVTAGMRTLLDTVRRAEVEPVLDGRDGRIVVFSPREAR